MALIKNIDVTNYETKTITVEITDPTGTFTLGSTVGGVKMRDLFLGTGFSIVKGATTYIEGRDFSLTQSDEDAEMTSDYGVALYSSCRSYKLSGAVTVTYRQVATYDEVELILSIEDRVTDAEIDIDTLTTSVSSHESNTDIHVTAAWKLSIEGKSAVHAVADITARDALTEINNGDICRVADAGDGKFAAYLRVDDAWTVLSDADWENLSVAWSVLTNVPANIAALASAADISTASTGQVPAKSASGGLEWVTPSAAAGVGDVVGPSSSTDEGVALFSGVTGKLLRAVEKYYFLRPDTIISDLTGLSGSVTKSYRGYKTVQFVGAPAADLTVNMSDDGQFEFKLVNNITTSHAITVKPSAASSGYVSYKNDVLDFLFNASTIKLLAWNANMPLGIERLSPGYEEGSPVYWKLIDTGAMPSSATNTIAHGITGTFTVISREGIAWDSSGVSISLKGRQYYNGVEYYIYLYSDNTYIYVRDNANLSALSKSRTLLKYVKAAL